MNKQVKRKTIQIVIDEETYYKLDRLMMMEALENNTCMSNLSQWVRTLIEDTVNFQINKSKISDYKGELIKQLKSK